MDALRQQGEPVLLVDAGDAVAARSSQILNEAVLAALAAGGYAALNVGDEEAAWGLDRLRNAGSGARLPLLSSNLVERATGKLAFTPELSLTVQGVRVALLGVIAPGWEKRRLPRPADEFTTLEPAEALAGRVARLRPDHDLIVVLAQLTRDQARTLLEQVAGIDLLVGGEDRGAAPASEPFAGAFWLQSKPYGRDIVMARVDVQSNPATVLESKEIPVAPNGPANAKVAQLIAEAQKKAAPTPSPFAMGYRGATLCKRCHGAQHASWAATPHAAAYDTLKKEKRQTDAWCLTCHTTGPPDKPASTTFPGVQCEACHGPFSTHDARFVRGGQHASQTDWKTVCVRCHDPANSPDFELESYLPRVRHLPPEEEPPAPSEKAP